MSLSENQAPHYEVSVGSVTCTHTEPNGMEYLQVEDHVDLIGVARVSLGLECADWASIKIGDEVTIKVGGSSRKMFVGQVTGFRHSWQAGKQTLTVIAMDPLVLMSASRRTQIFEEQKDSDVVSAVISASGASAGTVDSTSETHVYIFQRNESDLNFAKRMAARNGYLLMANEGKVDFTKAQFSDSPVEINPGTLLALDWESSDVQVPPELTVIGWDYLTKETVEATASSGAIETIGGGSNAVSEAKTWAETSYVTDLHVTTQAGATAVAEGELNRLARNFLRGRAQVEGTDQIYAGKLVSFVEQRTGFNPTGFVVSTRHIIEPNKGYTTEIFFCSNTHPE